MKVLLTSTSCGCCKGYAEKVKSMDDEINIVNASSMLGKELMKQYNVKGLPFLIYNEKTFTGNYNVDHLKSIIFNKKDFYGD